MENLNTYDMLVQLATVIFGLLVGSKLAVPLVNKLKVWFGLEGGQVHVLLGAVSLVITLCLFLIEGKFAPGSIDTATLGVFALSIIYQANARYTLLKKEYESNKTEDSEKVVFEDEEGAVYVEYQKQEDGSYKITY